MSAVIRVLIADDSRTMRARLRAALAHRPAAAGAPRSVPPPSGPTFEVVGEAPDGRRAVELCAELRPDVVALDLVMPDMSGIQATEEIMARCPTPILIVSSAENRGEAFRTLDALGAGAVDYVEKPGAKTDDDVWDRALRRALAMVAGVRVITHLGARLRSGGSLPPSAGVGGAAPRAVALAASTGGPSAVAEVLRGLPATFPAPILVVIHVGPAFGASLAAWLDGQSPLRVSLAEDLAPLPPPGPRGRVLLAPADRHLVVEAGKLRLTSDAERHSCRPSADVLFESVARELGAHAVGCLLTGMGADGAAGLLAMRRAGAATIAQDQASCAVFGMPREAIALGAAGEVLALRDIAPRLRGHFEAIPTQRSPS